MLCLAVFIVLDSGSVRIQSGAGLDQESVSVIADTFLDAIEHLGLTASVTSPFILRREHLNVHRDSTGRNLEECKTLHATTVDTCGFVWRRHAVHTCA